MSTEKRAYSISMTRRRKVEGWSRFANGIGWLSRSLRQSPYPTHRIGWLVSYACSIALFVYYMLVIYDYYFGDPPAPGESGLPEWVNLFLPATVCVLALNLTVLAIHNFFRPFGPFRRRRLSDGSEALVATPWLVSIPMLLAAAFCAVGGVVLLLIRLEIF